MKIGILGSGLVGQALGSGFTTLGHRVTLGTREPESDKVRLWRKQVGGEAATATFAEAATFGELLVLATAWAGAENAIRLADAQHFAGKVVIDVTNPLAMRPNAPPTLAVGHTDSAGERVQRWLPQAQVVKAFNTVGNAHMFRPHFPGGPPAMFIAGNSDPAKQAVADLVTAFGWEPIDVGGIESARYLESLAMLWITYGLRTNTWNHAFKLVRRA
jgi:predicted dinucleotide-binding enzyme